MTLLDDLQEMDDNLNKDATHVLDFQVHAPWPKLEVIEKDLKELNDRYNDFDYSKDKIINFNETLLDKVSPSSLVHLPVGLAIIQNCSQS